MHAPRRFLIVTLTMLVAIGVASAAQAQGAGHGPGGDPGARDGGGPSGALGPAGPGSAGPGPTGPATDGSPFTLPWLGTSEQDQALDAVRAEKALPLDQIIAAARHVTQGEIVNAELETVEGTLLYKLKVIEESGDVREFYFQALSGALARIH